MARVGCIDLLATMIFMRLLIEKIHKKNKLEGIKINKPATNTDIQKVEAKLGFELPNDFKELYSICNGFECTDDIFNFIKTSEIAERKDDYGDNWFYFAEYMIYSDMWGVRILNSTSYEIFNGSYTKPILTTSLREFLEHFEKGNVFEKGGLYEWQEQLGIKG